MALNTFPDDTDSVIILDSQTSEANDPAVQLMNLDGNQSQEMFKSKRKGRPRKKLQRRDVDPDYVTLGESDSSDDDDDTDDTDDADESEDSDDSEDPEDNDDRDDNDHSNDSDDGDDSDGSNNSGGNNDHHHSSQRRNHPSGRRGPGGNGPEPGSKSRKPRGRVAGQRHHKSRGQHSDNEDSTNDDDSESEAESHPSSLQSSQSTIGPILKKGPKRVLSDSEQEDGSKTFKVKKAKEDSTESDPDDDLKPRKGPSKRIKRLAEESSDDERNLSPGKRTSGRRNSELDPKTSKGKRKKALEKYQRKRMRLTSGSSDEGKLVVK